MKLKFKLSLKEPAKRMLKRLRQEEAAAATEEEEKEKELQDYRRSYRVNDPPLTLTDEDVAEGNGIGKFGFILDCNPVVQILNGWAPSDRPDTDPKCDYITNRIATWMGDGWGLAPDPHHPCQWRPREWNKVADWLANRAMNTRGTELGANKRPMGINWRAWNILTFTDGGVRKRRIGDEAGIGWVVVGIRGKKVMRLIEGFRYLEKEGGRVDSFKTEVWALWDAVRSMDEFMKPRTISLMAGERWVPKYEDYITKERDWVDKNYDTKAVSDEIGEEEKRRKRKDEDDGEEGKGGGKKGQGGGKMERRKKEGGEQEERMSKRVRFTTTKEEGRPEKRKPEDEVNERETKKILRELEKEERRGTKTKSVGEKLPPPKKRK